MSPEAPTHYLLEGLNAEQQEAVLHGDDPLLLIAGAGTGKTRTLVHRVAHLIHKGVDPARILLPTFTRRAASEMLRRVDEVLHDSCQQGVLASGALSRQVWGGTFHAVATRLLRRHAAAIGIDEGFTIVDRSDAEDLLDVVRSELELRRTDKRFPRKAACLAIYSHSVNAQQPLPDILSAHFPWCKDYVEDLKRLFRAYVDRKIQANICDYDDLLLFWQGMLNAPQVGPRIVQQFDAVLVDEYQDTNQLQASILSHLSPAGKGLTAVGDDAQSIYSFRAATIRNILDFPEHFPASRILRLEQNYRSTMPILKLTNQVIAESSQRYTKELWTARQGGAIPQLVTCQHEDEQAEFLVTEILQQREAGIELREQAVLFRAAQHSSVLEAELARRNVPFVKYGGLKFIETAHTKDLMALLRLAENCRDWVAGNRVLLLLPGIGPARARKLLDLLSEHEGDYRAWSDAPVPLEAAPFLRALVDLLVELRSMADHDLASQVALARTVYQPLLERNHNRPATRARDLEQLERLSDRFPNRQTMLSEWALDPPVTAEDYAGDPLLDEDYLILSTMHSAKGLEWKNVYTIHAADGNIPADLATRNAEQLEEERRLFYVALTRAQDRLFICFPQCYYHAARGPRSDRHGMAQLTRFLTPATIRHLDCVAANGAEDPDPPDPTNSPAAVDIRQQVKELWS